MARLLLPACVLLLALASGGGCAARTGTPTDGDAADLGPGEPIPPSFEPIVFPRQGREDTAAGPLALRREERPVDPGDAGWQEKLDLVSGYAAGGYDEQALALVGEVLAQNPPPAWRERFTSLRASLRLKRVEHDWLRVEARGVKDYVRFASDVDWLVRIRNVSGTTLVLQAPGEGPGRASPSALSLGIARRDVDIYGGELERDWNQTVYLQRPGGADIRIPPGGVHEARVRVPAEDVGAAISGLRILELTGTLRAVVTDEGGEPRSVGLRIRPGRVVVVPDGYEQLTADPLAAMETAIGAVAPTHLLVATEFVPRGKSDDAVDLLADALSTGDPVLRTPALAALRLLRERNVGRPLARFATPLVDALSATPERGRALMEALTVVSGQALAEDPRLWMDWWRRAERDGSTVRPLERARTPGTPQEER